MAGGSYDRSQNKSQLNPAVSYAFALEVEAAFFLPLRSVRVFTKENEFDYYQEGGLNDYVHMLRKPVSKPFSFQVERYVGVDAGFLDMNSGFIDPLALGTDLILPLVLYVNRSPSANWYKNISFTNCARAYVFTGCTVMSKEYGELNAEQSKLLTETTTISYRELFVLNQISPDWEKGDVWQIDKDDYKGTGEAHDSNRTKGNSTKADGEFQGRRNQWRYPGTPKDDISTDHIGNRSTNDSKVALEKKGSENQWIIDKGHPTGGGKSHESNRSVNQKAAPSVWEYDGTVAGSGTSHTQNRNQNEKPEPVIWPPTRRALMAQALSDL